MKPCVQALRGFDQHVRTAPDCINVTAAALTAREVLSMSTTTPLTTSSELHGSGVSWAASHYGHGWSRLSFICTFLTLPDARKYGGLPYTYQS